MNIKLKNSEIVPAVVESFRTIMDNENVPARVGYWTARIAKRYDEIAEIFDKSLKSLFEKYVERDADGEKIPATQIVKNEDGTEREEVVENAYKIKDVAAYTQEVESLLAIENTIEIEKLSMDDFADTKMKPKTFLAILWMLEEPKKPE